MRRFALLFVVAVSAGCSVSSAGSSMRTQPPGPAGGSPSTAPFVGDGPLTGYRGNGITFRYPVAWRHHGPGWIASLAANFLDLSTQPIASTCHTRGNSTSCGLPREHLRPNGLLVSWVIDDGFLPSHRPRPGTRITVTAPRACGILRASEAITARVVTATHRIFQVTACLRGPDLRANAAAVRAMVASVRPAG